jgi:hypothetical protein
MLEDEPRKDPQEGDEEDQPSDEELTPGSEEAKKAEPEEDAEDSARKSIDDAFD